MKRMANVWPVKIFSKMAFFVCVVTVWIVSATHAKSDQAIAVLVNDEPISAYDIDQRLRLVLLNAPEAQRALRSKLKSESTKNRFRKLLQERRPTSREEVEVIKAGFVKSLRREVINSIKPKLRKQVLETLIDEKLMLQEAKKLNLVVSDDDVTKQITGMAQRSKDRQTGKPLSTKQFLGQLRQLGVSPEAFKARLRARIALQRIVMRKYGRHISIGQQQVDRLLDNGNTDTAAGKKETEFQLQKIRLSVPSGANQKVIGQRLAEADRLRGKFSSCKKTKALLKDLKGASVQSLGKRTPAQIPQPARAMLVNAKAGDMTPPNVIGSAIELYAVCNRKQVADTKKREKVKAQLRQQEYDIMRRRYMRDLRQDAFLDYRK